MSGYTVIDLETTGLFPEKHDRIVEIGVTYVSHDGEIQDHWATLVDPRRDVGPTRIHGITATDVIGAPTFSELVPYLLRAIVGRVLVAHNASFDLRFLAAELQQSGLSLPELPLVGVCTMRWAPTFVDAVGRRLEDCCHAYGIQQGRAHSAGDDAMATAQLLSRYLAAAHYRPPWEPTLLAARRFAWPQYHGEFPELHLWPRSGSFQRQQGEWLDRVVARLPRSASPVVDEYLALLDMALLDGFLAQHEKESLVMSARQAGLSRGQVLDIHAGYLLALARTAWSDGVVTVEEESELRRVAEMLGLRSDDVEYALAEAEVGVVDDRLTEALVMMSGLALKPGDRVCFTGEMSAPRSEWESAALSVGLVPSGLTKATKLLVAADPNSASGKAAKARSYGLPIVTEAFFVTLMEALSGQCEMHGAGVRSQ